MRCRHWSGCAHDAAFHAALDPAKPTPLCQPHAAELAAHLRTDMRRLQRRWPRPIKETTNG